MGFNNCYLPDFDKLKEYFDSVDLETFVNRFRKYDCWTGSSESMDFLEQKVKEYENNEQIIITTNTDFNRM